MQYHHDVTDGTRDLLIQRIERRHRIRPDVIGEGRQGHIGGGIRHSCEPCAVEPHADIVLAKGLVCGCENLVDAALQLAIQICLRRRGIQKKHIQHGLARQQLFRQCGFRQIHDGFINIRHSVAIDIKIDIAHELDRQAGSTDMCIAVCEACRERIWFDHWYRRGGYRHRKTCPCCLGIGTVNEKVEHFAAKCRH